MVVVLPAPFGPRIAVTSPRRAVRLSPSTAVAGPYRLTMPKSSTAGLGSARGETGGALLTDAVYGSVPGYRTARVRQSVVDLTKTPPGISALPGHMDVALGLRATSQSVRRRRARRPFWLPSSGGGA